MNYWGQKAGEDSINKYEKRMEMGQEEGFGVVEDGSTEQPVGGTEMEVEKEAEKEVAEDVSEINESGGKTIFTMQEDEILTQQSATALNIEEGGVLEEQLLDYDEDPLVVEKLAMVELEKKVELRANKLVKDVAIIIQSEKGVREEKIGNDSDITSEGTEEEEIDWDGVQVALDANKEINPRAFTEKKSGDDILRRSARNSNDNNKIQDKAEAAKKKYNEIPGNLPSFVVLNSVRFSVLENLDATSNIKLRTSSDEIVVVIDTMQSKELAKATLLAAKLRVTEQAKQKEVESEVLKHTSI
jgi:hypothetical protein